MNYALVNAFVKLIAPEVTIIFSKTEYNSFDFGTDCIYFNPFDRNDKGFMKHICKKHKCNFVPNFDLNLWTILHEIGHYYTSDIITFDEEEESTPCYFDQNEEWEATEWAINYIKTHRIFCEIFNKILKM